MFVNIKGFSLIELMIVISILGILVAVAIPSYSNFTIRSANNACLAEVKAYSNEVFLALNDQDDNSYPARPSAKACQTITDASSWTTVTQQRVIHAQVKAPSQVRIQCDLPNGVPCQIVP